MVWRVGVGVLYSVLPLNDQVRVWLDNEGLEYPRGVEGRRPSPRELAEAAASVDGFKTDESTGKDWWQLSVSGTTDPSREAWTLVNALKFAGRDTPCEFYFEKGWPDLIVKIVRALAAVTGPVVLVPDTGCGPAVIHADVDVESLLETWEHTRPG